MRRAWWIFQVSACLCLGLCIPYLAKWGYDQFVYGNAWLKVSQMRITTTGSLPQSVIVGASGVKSGSSLAGINLKQVTSRIVSLPEVETAEVSRILPDTLKISVTERVPAAWLSSPQLSTGPLRKGGMLLDRNGVVFACRNMNDRLISLPTVEIGDTADSVAGQTVNSPQLTKALKLIDASRLVFASQEMKIIDVRALGSWGLLCRYPDNLLVTFDIHRIEEGLLDLDEILKRTSRAGLSLATVNLVTVKNIPVTFHSQNAPLNW